MSRIGRKPIKIAEGVEVNTGSSKIKLKGPKGELEIILPDEIAVESSEGSILVKLKKGSKAGNLHGLYRTLIYNAVVGVSRGWSKTLKLVGVGFRAQSSEKELTLNVGFSHPVVVAAPSEISFKVEDKNIVVSGIDKYLVGETAAKIRKVKPPDAYKGKGIRYKDEEIRKKPGKAGKAVSGIAGK